MCQDIHAFSGVDQQLPMLSTLGPMMKRSSVETTIRALSSAQINSRLHSNVWANFQNVLSQNSRCLSSSKMMQLRLSLQDRAKVAEQLTKVRPNIPQIRPKTARVGSASASNGKAKDVRVHSASASKIPEASATPVPPPSSVLEPASKAKLLPEQKSTKIKLRSPSQSWNPSQISDTNAEGSNVVQGIINRIYFHVPGDVIIAALENEKDGSIVRFVGKIGSSNDPKVSDFVSVSGVWETHGTYGLQLKGQIQNPEVLKGSALASDSLPDLSSSPDQLELAGPGSSNSQDRAVVGQPITTLSQSCPPVAAQARGFLADDSEAEQKYGQVPKWFDESDIALSPSGFCKDSLQKTVARIMSKNLHRRSNNVVALEIVTSEKFNVMACDMLQNGKFDRIGPKLAERITSALGEDFQNILEMKKDEAVTVISEKVFGVSPRVAARIYETWHAQNCTELAQFLVERQLSYSDFRSIHRRFRKKLLEPHEEDFVPTKETEKRLMTTFTHNPYDLVRDRILSFTVLDPHVPRLSKFEKSREHAALFQTILDVTHGFGHTCLPIDVAVVGMTFCTQSTPVNAEQAVKDAIDAGFPMAFETVEDVMHIYESHVHMNEKRVIKRLQLIQQTMRAPELDQEEKKFYSTIQPSAHGLSETQKKHLQTLTTEKVSVLTGYAGTGKTYMLREVARSIELQGRSVAVVAPTGRAAQRLHDSTGLPAATVHRLLKPAFNGKVFDFTMNSGNPLQYDTIIVDEASMLSLDVAADLLDAVKSTSSIIFVGDPAQLQSVGQGNLLHDLNACKQIPTCALTEVFRQQGADNEILRDATLVRNGKTPDMLSTPTTTSHLAEQSSEVMAKRLKGEEFESTGKVFFIPCRPEDVDDILLNSVYPYASALGLDAMEDVQVITPRRIGMSSVADLNPLLQKYLNRENQSSSEIWIQDKIIQLKNCYGKNVFNGHIGTVESILQDYEDIHQAKSVSWSTSMNRALSQDRDPKQAPYLIAQFADEGSDLRSNADDGLKFDRLSCGYSASEWRDELELAYATTIHKAQGSQFPLVVLPFFREHGIFLNRNLLYTAMTRAQQYVIVLGDPGMIKSCVKSRSNERFSLFTQLFEK